MKKSLGLLGALAAILVIGYLIMMQSEKKALSPQEKANFVGADSGQVNRITVARLGANVEFQLRDGLWQVLDNGQPRRADQNVLHNVANLAHNLTVGDIISSNPEKQMLFEVDTLVGRTVTFYRDQQELGRLIVGKQGSDFRSTYVRNPGSPDVYLATAAITRLFDRPARGYRDKVIHALDTAQIASVIVKTREYQYQLTRLDPSWVLVVPKTGTAAADSIKAGAFVILLANLRITDFVDPAEAAGVTFAADADQITISMRDGSSVTLSLQMKDEASKNYYLRTSLDPDLYTVAEHVRNNLVKKPDELK